jgi:hypothetical protein
MGTGAENERDADEGEKTTGPEGENEQLVDFYSSAMSAAV